MLVNRDYAEFLSSFQSDKFRNLRNAQDYVLREYSNKHVEQSDVAIELPTGAGKTLIALLISEAWRQEGKKVAILSANKTLARQMLGEATALGIPAVLMEGRGVDISASDKRAYERGIKVAIMNYWVYFNQNPVIDCADLLIMDDAHLAEHCLHSLFSVEISRYSHENLFDTLTTELHARFPEYSVLADAIARDVPATSPTELLSFIDQQEIANRVREIIDTSPYLEADTDLDFRWRRLRNYFQQANVYLSLHSIWIRPYIYPLRSTFHYAEAKQRIYMSATIGDPGDLSRRLGVRRITKIQIPAEYADTTSGRRLIVMNRIEEQDIPTRLQAVILAALQIHPKSVWLCSSEKEARKYQEVVSTWLNLSGLVGHPIWLLTPLGDEIDRFKASPNGHLFVAGRFDGMDFKADECRLVVLTTLPRAINTQEEFISSHLRDSGFMLRRLNQRVVQALGRCNRSDDDFGVYVLADRRFATHFGRESQKVGLPGNIIAEIDMAQDMAEIPVDELVKKTDKFLRGDFSDHDHDIQTYLDGIPSNAAQTQLSDTSEDEVMGWASLYSQNYEIAADRFESCWEIAQKPDLNLIEIGAFYGWQWAKALYLQSSLGERNAREKALKVFEDAIKRGGHIAWFNRMRGSLNRARQTFDTSEESARQDYSSHIIQTFDDILENQGDKRNRFDKWSNKITMLLESDSHKQYQEGLEKLGEVLGYRAIRPHYDTATDCRWRGVFGNTRELITFEAKIEHSALTEIVARDVGQAHNQLARASAEYESHGYIVRGTIVTHLTALTADAEASIGSIKVIDKAALLAVWERVKLLLSLYRDSWSLHDIPGRIAAAQKLRPMLPPISWLARVLDSDTAPGFIGAEHLLAEWPQP